MVFVNFDKIEKDLKFTYRIAIIGVVRRWRNVCSSNWHSRVHHLYPGIPVPSLVFIIVSCFIPGWPIPQFWHHTLLQGRQWNSHRSYPTKLVRSVGITLTLGGEPWAGTHPQHYRHKRWNAHDYGSSENNFTRCQDKHFFEGSDNENLEFMSTKLFQKIFNLLFIVVVHTFKATFNQKWFTIALNFSGIVLGRSGLWSWQRRIFHVWEMQRKVGNEHKFERGNLRTLF